MTTIEEVQAALRGRFGLSPREGWHGSLERAISDIGTTANLSGEKLLANAISNPCLLREIAGRITVPESFFFRHPEQLDLIANFVKQQLSRTNLMAMVRVWSAGCSQGEEPLTLAILLKEILSENELARVSILGSDISAGAIAVAREGIYSPWSFRGTNEERRRVYFESLDERRFRLRDDIRSMVEFQNGSIQEQLSAIEPESIDVVMFRNVAIYLTEESLPPLYERISLAMRAGGWLCLSHSDPPVNQATLERLEGSAAPIYRKLSPQARCEACVLTLPMAPSPSTSPVSTSHPKRLTLPRRVSSPPGLGVYERPVRLQEGFAKADQGFLRDAAKIAEELVTGHPDSSHGYYLSGQLSLAAENSTQAEEAFRKAVFADPVDLLARFWYAVVLFERDARKRSRAQMTALATELSGLDEDRILTDGDTTAGQLLQTVRAFLQKMEYRK